jgi:hypothetical protein
LREVGALGGSGGPSGKVMSEGTADFGSRLAKVGRVVCEVEDGGEREEEGGAGRGREDEKQDGREDNKESQSTTQDKKVEWTNRRCPRKPKRP